MMDCDVSNPQDSRLLLALAKELREIPAKSRFNHPEFTFQQRLQSELYLMEQRRRRKAKETDDDR